MNLKDFLARRDGETELYWALVVEAGWIQAGIWEISKEKAEVISMSSPVAWETDEDFIEASDGALSSAISTLPEDTGEPTKTVFGISPSWVSEGQIKEEYLAKIKKLCSDLSLEPKGFVVLPEAIAHLVKSEEGSPLNAVVIGVGKDNLEVAIFKLGNPTGTTTVARSVSVVDDISEGLSRFSQVDPFPSRFVIYDGKEGELEDVKNSITNANWEKYEKINFLHTPKVEIFSSERKVLATALAGASEIANITFVEAREKEILPQGEESSVQEVSAPGAINPEELGFIVGQDIAGGEKQKPISTQNFPMTKEQSKANSFFETSKTVAKTKFFGTSFFTKISGILRKIRLPQGRGTLTTGITILTALVAIFLILWIFIPKATVTIFVSPKKVEEITKVLLDSTTTDVDLQKGMVPVSILTSEVSGDKTESTTGTKKIGDKAKGLVKIQNGRGEVINLPEGTIIVATNNLGFTLDNAASISAALSPGNPGTTDAQVTAADIGAEYNIAKDETLTIGNYPKAEVDAITSSDFSGGNSTEISAVSAQDQSKLFDDLVSELKGKARSDINSKLGNDRFFIDNSLTATPSSKVFSNKVGDQAGNLKLSLTMEAKAFAANKNDLIKIAKEILKGKVPTGYVLREDQLSFSFNDKELTIAANLLPEIKLIEIARNLSGKLPSQAEGYLTSIPGFTRAEVNIKPKFPGPFGIIPFFTKNITVEIEKET